MWMSGARPSTCTTLGWFSGCAQTLQSVMSANWRTSACGLFTSATSPRRPPASTIFFWFDAFAARRYSARAAYFWFDTNSESSSDTSGTRQPSCTMRSWLRAMTLRLPMVMAASRAQYSSGDAASLKMVRYSVAEKTPTWFSRLAERHANAREQSAWMSGESMVLRWFSGPKTPSFTSVIWLSAFSAVFAMVAVTCDARSRFSGSCIARSKSGPRPPSSTMGRLMRDDSDRWRSAPHAMIWRLMSSSRASAIMARRPPSCAKVTLLSLFEAMSRSAAAAWRWIFTSRSCTSPSSGSRPPLAMMASWLSRFGVSLRKMSDALSWHSLSLERATRNSERRPSLSRKSRCVARVPSRFEVAREASRCTATCRDRMRKARMCMALPRSARRRCVFLSSAQLAQAPSAMRATSTSSLCARLSMSSRQGVSMMGLRFCTDSDRTHMHDAASRCVSMLLTS
mmetsp:Transcript_38267/g.120022  ORF Transcript_38267/g.120022 Transcript_38267/m.120022 type:complete len:454 (-) Transcript_38267:297-1658(-)